MAKENLEILTMCSVCKAIKIAGNWLREKDNLKLYQGFMREYQGNMRISHGYCPECYEKTLEEIEKNEK